MDAQVESAERAAEQPEMEHELWTDAWAGLVSADRPNSEVMATMATNSRLVQVRRG
jgi:hypothetical protein